MSETGSFQDFALDYTKYTNQQQAILILKEAQRLISNGSKGVAITYSANYGQTYEIEKTYFAGGWKTGTSGANQAEVMTVMETAMGSAPYDSLQGKMRILPITTMNGAPGASPWDDDIHMGIVTTDLNRIRIYLEVGWNVLGWQNQKTVGNLEHPYAVGGGIASLPPRISDKIQGTLIDFAKKYG